MVLAMDEFTNVKVESAYEKLAIVPFWASPYKLLFPIP
jgi:hypothetical protein